MPSLKAEADEWRMNLVETAVGQDDAAMEAYLEGNEPTRKPQGADPQGDPGDRLHPGDGWPARRRNAGVQPF